MYIIIKHSSCQERVIYLRCICYDVQERNRSLINRKAVEGVSLDEFEPHFTIFDGVKDLIFEFV